MNKLLVTCSALFFAAAPILDAQQSPNYWLNKMRGQVGKPMEMRANLDGVIKTFTTKMVARTIYADTKHFKVTQTVERLVKGQEDPLIADLVQVADGETMWMAAKSTFDKVWQVRKSKVATFQQNMQRAGGMGLNSMHPISVVMSIVQAAEFTEVEIENGKVTLKGKITEQGKQYLAQATQLLEGTKMTLMIDEATFLPSFVRLDGTGGDYMETRYTMTELAREKIDYSVFAYEPPEGASVQDMEKQPPAKKSGH